jgi:hypothetical protein
VGGPKTGYNSFVKDGKGRNGFLLPSFLLNKKKWQIVAGV